MRLNERPVRILMREMTEKKAVAPGQILTKQEIIAWFGQHFPNVKQGTVEAHLTRMSVNAASRLHHNLMPDGSDDLFYKIDAGRYRLYDPQRDPAPITLTTPISDVLPDAERFGEGFGRQRRGIVRVRLRT